MTYEELQRSHDALLRQVADLERVVSQLSLAQTAEARLKTIEARLDRLEGQAKPAPDYTLKEGNTPLARQLRDIVRPIRS